MKKLYSLALLLMVSTCAVQAQNKWGIHRSTAAPTPSASPATPSTKATGVALVGYAHTSDKIYQHSGIFSYTDARVGCCIYITPEMLKPYVGGKITAMRVGWGTGERDGELRCFVREGFDGKYVADTVITVKYGTTGWNSTSLKNQANPENPYYTIPEEPVGLTAGFYTDVSAEEYAIPTIMTTPYPEHCSYVWLGDAGAKEDEVEKTWEEYSKGGKQCIILVIQDQDGSFSYLADFSFLNHNTIVVSDSTSVGRMAIENKGTKGIKNIEVTTTCGVQSYSQTVNVTCSNGQVSSAFYAPIYCHGTGTHTVAITKVNGEDNQMAASQEVELVGVPKDVAAKYDYTAFLEFFTTENSDKGVEYYDSYYAPTLEGYNGKLVSICQHTEDQFMTGEGEHGDAMDEYLDLVCGDSLRVYMPAATINRSFYTEEPGMMRQQAYSPVWLGIYYITVAQPFYDTVLKMPTFAQIEANGVLEADATTLTINATGQYEEGILPEGENPRVTVYLMEKDVWSDSQKQFNKETGEYIEAEYTHPNIVRQILTESIDGDEVSGGSFDLTYTTEVDETWKKADLYIVAIVNRSLNNSLFNSNVLNACEGEIDTTTAIAQVTSDKGQVTSIYDLQGRRLSRLQKGVNIVGKQKVLCK